MRNGFRIAGVALLAGLSGAFAQETKTVRPGTPVNITVSPAQPSSPPVSITLGSRAGHVTPTRIGCTHTAGGNVDVQQPSSDTVVVTVTGVAVAYGHPCGGSTATMGADVEQCFEITFDNPKVKKAKLTIEGRVVGLLRSHCKGGTAAYDHACASISSGPSALTTLTVPPHAVAEGDNLSVNDREGPITIPVLAGKFTLHQKFVVTATAPKCILPCKAPSAEFAPDALDPLWISFKEPFKGASKKDFGFQVTIKVAEDTDNGDEKKDEKKADDKPAELPKIEEKK
jgi:hypothetical protein